VHMPTACLCWGGFSSFTQLRCHLSGSSDLTSCLRWVPSFVPCSSHL
jgi:hypothetical protein